MLNFGISPCPNDIFIFYSMLNNRINLRNFSFNFIIEDVERLNNLCMKGKLPISKVSVHAFYYFQDKYDFLNSGGAISEFGPVAVTKDLEKISQLPKIRIALPGKLTTASALMWFYWKKFFSKKRYSLHFIRYDQIFDKLLNDEVDIGVLIHEGRFIYKSLGLSLIVDLGEFWKKETNTPIPLGCIVMRKQMPYKEALERMIRESIKYSKNNIDEVMPFIKKYAQELDDKVIMSHIKTYVNDFSFDLAEQGRASIDIFLKKIKEVGIWR
ncbi:1,4-dihydroxy-6-naphthoate synthase [Thermodesulfovibrio hydrogeniphilus]